ncbi:hypothetical protein [Psychromicrobium lacuslunae]|uniref:Uncharacterized protein n=1 Tax=Psychromicrobium lacuslunae TaxID=1618207 RepID=A0A0D4BWH8_9MICC|nr:hypothetical protein [Psychromicrobium lacuslunae]AJT40481.1 hypothetical protein UM93_01040 [Psychromicrobium lacuslunae]
MGKFLHYARPWIGLLLALYALWCVVFSVLNIATLFQHEPKPSPAANLYIASMLPLLGLIWLLNRASRSAHYAYETATYRAVEHGAEFTVAVSIQAPAEQVRNATAEAISADTKLLLVDQGEDWFRASLGKKYDRAGYWLAAYLRPEAETTTLIIGFSTSTVAFQAFRLSKRRVLKLLKAIEERLSPVPLRPGLTEAADQPLASAGQQLPQ